METNTHTQRVKSTSDDKVWNATFDPGFHTNGDLLTLSWTGD